MRTIRLTHEVPEATVAAIAGTHLGEDAYDVLLSEDVDVYRPDGTILARMRKGCVPAQDCQTAYRVLRTVKAPLTARGTSTGKGLMHYRLKRDGTLSNTRETGKRPHG